MKRGLISFVILSLVMMGCKKKPTTTVVSTSTTSTSARWNESFGCINISVFLNSVSTHKQKGACVNYGLSLDSLQKKMYWHVKETNDTGMVIDEFFFLKKKYWFNATYHDVVSGKDFVSQDTSCVATMYPQTELLLICR